MKDVVAAISGERRDAVGVGLERQVAGGRAGGLLALDDLQLAWAGNHHPFARVADDLVGHQDHRDPEPLGEVERLHREGEAFADGGRTQRDHRLVAVPSPADLHDVRLARLGRQPGAGPARCTLTITQGTSPMIARPMFSCIKREPGAAGRGKSLGAGQRCADHGGDRGDLVFHLHEDAAELRQPDRAFLGDFGRRRDRIAGIEAGARVQRAFGNGLVALHQPGLICHAGFPLGRLRRLNDAGTVRRWRAESGGTLTHVIADMSRTLHGHLRSCTRAKQTLFCAQRELHVFSTI